MSNLRLSVSSWSLNKALGKPAFYGVEQAQQIPIESHGLGKLSLLELPQAIANFGINTLEITHFHLPSLDDAYLAELKQALQDANVELFSLLIDDGDITHPVHAERDLDWITKYIDIAAKLGSSCVRVIAGKQEPSTETLELSIKNLKRLTEKADSLGIRLMTENWFDTTSTPEAIIQIFEALNGKLGLCLDFGNWQGNTKYADFEKIAHYAESCHTKAFFEEGTLNIEDYERCLGVARAANFNGPYTLIFESQEPKDEWQGLQAEKEIVSAYL